MKYQVKYGEIKTKNHTGCGEQRHAVYLYLSIHNTLSFLNENINLPSSPDLPRITNAGW